MCSAIERRITLSFTSSSRLPSTWTGAGAAAAFGAAGAAGAAVVAWPPTAARTSPLVTRPPTPLPRQVPRCRPCSAASFLTLSALLTGLGYLDLGEAHGG